LTSGRRPRAEILQIKKYIANLLTTRKKEITNNLGHISPMKIQRLMQEDTGMLVKEHVISKYLKTEDLTDYQRVTTIAENTRMIDLDKRIQLAKQISEDENVKSKERIMALNSYKGLFAEKSRYEKQLMEERIKVKEVSKPIHIIKYGQLENIKKVCPKCKHEFYDIIDEEKNDGKEKNTKQKKFESRNGQSVLYKEKRKT
jgi:hypothetical protein